MVSIKSAHYNSSNSLRRLHKPQYITKTGDNWCWLIIGDLRYTCTQPMGKTIQYKDAKTISWIYYLILFLKIHNQFSTVKVLAIYYVRYVCIQLMV